MAEDTVVKQIADLTRMTVGQLREVYAEKFGEQTKSRNKQWLLKRIAWRIQELAEGGLSERAKKRAEELARDADLRLHPPKNHVAPAAAPLETPKRDVRLPAAGTELKRIFNDKEHVVLVGESGFRYLEKEYRSLSAIAKEISGTAWNGFGFFHLLATKEKA
jgi:hypothetical protein